MKSKIMKCIVFVCMLAWFGTLLPDFAYSASASGNMQGGESVDESEQDTNALTEPSIGSASTSTGGGIKKADSPTGAGNSEAPTQDKGELKGHILQGEVNTEEDISEPSSQDTLWKVAAGVLIGIALTLVIAAVWYKMIQKENDTGTSSTPQDKSIGKNKSDVKSPEKAQKADPAPMAAAVQSAGAARNLASTPNQERGNIGKVHNVGKRSSQQDSLGVTSTRWGILAVVSDGMGGLSDGEKVSRKAVAEMLAAAGQVAPPPAENPLYEMLGHANEQILQMLEPEQIYKSGATLLAVLANSGGFHWIAVGDSRIYFYCSGHLLQLNSEHIYKKELILNAVNKNISFSRVNTDSQRSRLISFLGMGELKYVEGSFRPVSVKPGDKLLLMSDGVFNTLREEMILRILESTKNAAEAAALLEEQVLAAGNPKQDNFSCIILDF